MSQFPDANPQPPTGTPGAAADKVKGPAIGLIVTAVLGILVALYGVVNNVMLMGGAGAQNAQLEQQMEQMQGQGLDPATMMQFMRAGGAVGIAFNIIGIIVSVVILLGALKLMKLESKGFATAAAILAMIPCISPCCLLGLPMGIWALMTMKDPVVQASFRS